MLSRPGVKMNGAMTLVLYAGTADVEILAAKSQLMDDDPITHCIASSYKREKKKNE